MSVTYKDIEKICTQLSVHNRNKITTRMIRDELGHGSLSTISKHLKAWRDQATSAPNNVHQLLASKITHKKRSVHKIRTPQAVQENIPVQTDCTDASVLNSVHPLLKTQIPESPTQSTAEKFSFLEQKLEDLKLTQNQILDRLVLTESGDSIMFKDPEPSSTKIFALPSNTLEEEPLKKIEISSPPFELVNLSEKVAVLQQSLEDFSAQTAQNLDSLIQHIKKDSSMPQVSEQAQAQMTMPISTEKPNTELQPKKEISPTKHIETQWVSIFHSLIEPQGLSLTLLVGVLSSYLFYQGFQFFQKLEPDFVTALSSALVSESIPIVCAGIFALSNSKRIKLISALFLIISVIGLGSFMREGVVGNSLTHNLQYKAVQEERDVILKSIESLNTSLAALPENYASKRETLRQEIETQRKNLNANTKATEHVSGVMASTANAAVSYNVWIRIAAMLINAMLIHLLFTRVKLCLISKQA